MSDDSIGEKLDEVISLLQQLIGSRAPSGLLTQVAAAKALGKGITSVKEMIRRGELSTRTVNGRRMVPSAEIERLSRPEDERPRVTRLPRRYSAAEEREKVRAALRKGN